MAYVRLHSYQHTQSVYSEGVTPLLAHLRKSLLVLALTAIALAVAACGGSPATSDSAGRDAGAGQQQPVLRIGAIPDQDVSVLTRTFNGTAEYLSEAIGLEVEYVPSNDYAALVTAFQRGDIHLAWFGGLTGVQAMEAVPGSTAIAQRPRDAEFRSVFIIQADLSGESIADLKGLTFTFGSESSTSGHLMPRYFMLQAGIDPETDLAGPPNYSGSHDKTIALVESGAFQAGALNIAVWESRVEAGEVDLEKVRVLEITDPYYDYHWVAHADIDKIFGEGTQQRIQDALLAMGPEQQEILDLFATDRFIPTKNENYEAIRQVAEQLGILRP